MKKYILLLLTIISFTAYSQTVPNLPNGAKPYGNQLYIVPSTGLIYGGNAGYYYRVLATKKYVDSLLALKQNTIPSGTYIENQRATYQSGGFKLDSASTLLTGKLSSDMQVFMNTYSAFPIKNTIYQSTQNAIPVNPAFPKHTFGSVVINEAGYSIPRSGSSFGIIGKTVIKKTNTSDWGQASYPSAIGVGGNIESWPGSSGIIRRSAAFYGVTSGQVGSALIDEAIGIELDLSGNNFNYVVGLRATDLDRGQLGNTGVYLGIQQQDYTAFGNWGVYDRTKYDSKTLGKWIAKRYETNFVNDSTITDWSNFKSVAPTGAGVITNMANFSAIESARGTNNVNLLIGTQAIGNWSIYNNSARNNYLGSGNTYVGASTDDGSGSKLQVSGNINISGTPTASSNNAARMLDVSNAITGLSSTYQPLENQRVSTTNSPLFTALTVSGSSAIFDTNGLVLGGGTSFTGRLFQARKLNTATSGALIDFSATSSNSSTSAAFTGVMRGVYSSPTIDAANTQNWNLATGSIIGFEAFPIISTGATGTVTKILGSKYSFSAGGMTTINYVGTEFVNPTGAGTLTNSVAIAINSFAKGTNNTHLLTGTNTAPTGNWNIYSSTAYANYLGTGKTTVGTFNVGTTTDYADNAAALAGGLVVGDVYRTGDLLKIVH